MELTVRHLGGVKFEATARGHRIVCDQPFDNSGTDRGMTPPELLLASLGTCVGYYAAVYLTARGLPTEDLSVYVYAEKSAPPARLSSFRVEVTSPVEDERHEAGLLRAVKSCLIHNTLLHAPSIDLSVNAKVAAL